ncbi:hypothetical protein BH09PSE6_BH09PSE6_17720 [soil metagenome]
MTPEQLDRFVFEAQDELRRQQAAVQEEYGLAAYEKFAVDYGAGTLSFLKDDVPEVVAQIVPILSFIEQSKMLVWAWSSDQVPAAARATGAKLKALADSTGLELFRKPNAPGTIENAWELIAIAFKQLEALSASRIPHGPVDSFVLVTSIERVEPA